jgi:hypothetical protein
MIISNKNGIYASTMCDAMKLCQAISCSNCIKQKFIDHYSSRQSGCCSKWNTIDAFKLYLLSRKIKGKVN